MKLRARPLGAFLVMGVMACDVPTGIPRWETSWITPGETTTVSVAELLPASIGITPDSSAFVVDFDAVSASWSLAEMCPACPPVTATAPKPAFTASVSTTMPLPADVRSLVVASGEIAVTLTNGFDFDPIRPGVNADSGSITITVRSGGTTVASLVVDGTDQAFPPGATLVESLSFLPATVADELHVELTIDSPAGDVTTLRPSDSLGASIASTGVLVSEATVEVGSQTISGVETELDLSDVDLGERLKEGTIFLEIENPFSLSGTLTLSVAPASGAGPFNKPVTLAPGTTETEVTFTEAELAEIVGQVSTLTIAGVVNAVGGAVTVRPDMVITVTTRLRVTVEVGGSSEDDSGF